MLHREVNHLIWLQVSSHMLVDVASEPVDDVDLRGAEVLELFDKRSMNTMISSVREDDEQRVVDASWGLR